MLPFIIVIYAGAFAFAAMTALRLPAMALIEQLAHEYGYGPEAAGIAGVNWRHVSILLGGPYLIASIAFYVAAALLKARWRGAGLVFKAGVALGFASVFLFDFRAGWWHDPTLWEWSVLGAACLTGVIYLGIILSYEAEDASQPVAEVREEVPSPQPQPIVEPVIAAPIIEPVARPKVRRRPRPVRPSPAVLRQRAAFAAEGRKMLAREAAARQPVRWRL